jgi:putative ABC transport system ATP-binding protein
VPSAETGSPPRLEVRGLTKVLSSGGRPLKILDAIDLTVQAGEFVAVLGPSGSGKSTLLALMAGLDRPTEGQVLIDGLEIQDLSEDALAVLRRDHVGFVFQSFRLLDHLTARENVLLPFEISGQRGSENLVDELLRRVDLKDRGHHYPSQLSGGEQQRIALARAFALEPSVLLADEPTGNLDSKNGEVILRILEDLRQQHGTTMVLVTHDPATAARADRRIYLHDGRIHREEVGRLEASPE